VTAAGIIDPRSVDPQSLENSRAAFQFPEARHARSPSIALEDGDDDKWGNSKFVGPAFANFAATSELQLWSPFTYIQSQSAVPSELSVDAKHPWIKYNLWSHLIASSLNGLAALSIAPDPLVAVRLSTNDCTVMRSTTVWPASLLAFVCVSTLL
jgi:hypothetical protein